MADTDTKDAPEQEGAEGAEEKEEVFVEAPSFDVEYKGDCVYAVKVTVPPANAKKQVDDMMKELQKEAEVPGFRKGRAPEKLLEKKFSKAVQAEADAKLAQASFEKLIEDEDLRPISPPDLEGLDSDDERNADEPLSFTLKFEVAPRVELGKYREVPVERPVVTVDEADVEDALEEIRERYSTFDELEGGVAAAGDQVVFDFKGTIDGEEFPGGSAENYPYILGSHRFFPEFEEALLGASPGDELSCDVTFPDDYSNANLQGKTAHFEITVNEVKRKSPPALDDDFAEQAGYENLEDMKGKIREHLQERSNERSQDIVQSRALDAVIENSKYELPKSMVERLTRGEFEDEIQRLRQARMSEKDIREREDDLWEEAKVRAERSIKVFVTLNEIGEAEGVEVTEEDLEREVQDMSARMGLSPDVVGQYMQDSERQDSYKDRLFREKALGIIVENAEITDVEVEREESESDHDE